MSDPVKNTIQFSITYLGEEYRIQTRSDEYPSLMSLISDQLPVSGFGLCSGMGSCGTCLVLIDGSPVLSCSVRIDDAIANTRILLKDTHF